MCEVGLEITHVRVIHVPHRCTPYDGSGPGRREGCAPTPDVVYFG